MHGGTNKKQIKTVKRCGKVKPLTDPGASFRQRPRRTTMLMFPCATGFQTAGTDGTFSLKLEGGRWGGIFFHHRSSRYHQLSKHAMCSLHPGVKSHGHEMANIYSTWHVRDPNHTHTHTDARARAHIHDTHTATLSHAHTHTRARAHTHTHTQTHTLTRLVHSLASQRTELSNDNNNQRHRHCT